MRCQVHYPFGTMPSAGFYEKLGYTKTEEYHMDEFWSPCDHAEKHFERAEHTGVHVASVCFFVVICPMKYDGILRRNPFRQCGK